MPEKKNEVAKAPKQQLIFSEALTNDLADVKAALPADFNVARFVQNSVTLMNENETLAKFANQNGIGQIKQGMLKAAYLGLDFMNNEAYLIPYGSTLKFMVDYRGNVKLAKKYSIRPIKDIYAKVVRDGDDFEETIVDGEQYINFKPKAFNDGEIIGAFAVCLYTDGGMVYDTMSIKDLENTRSASKAKNSPAWTKFTSEMYKKTVLHRLCKHIELEFENPDQRKYFAEDMEIETDTKKIVENEIDENANSEEFPDDDIETIDNPEVVNEENMPDFLKG